MSRTICDNEITKKQSEYVYVKIDGKSYAIHLCTSTLLLMCGESREKRMSTRGTQR
jgi:hypothetical protein